MSDGFSFRCRILRGAFVYRKLKIVIIIILVKNHVNFFL